MDIVKRGEPIQGQRARGRPGRLARSLSSSTVQVRFLLQVAMRLASPQACGNVPPHSMVLKRRNIEVGV